MMNSFQEDSNWNLMDYNSIIIEEAAAAVAAAASTDYYWSSNNNSTTNQSVCMELDASPAGFVSQEKNCSKKRGRNESCSTAGPNKACREKMRRDKMNDRFADLSSILEPGRPAKTDKSAILNDAIRALKQLRAESKDLKEANEKLQEEIKNLKAEKNELREEKLVLKADKEKMEQQVKSMNVLPGGFVSPHPATYPAGVNKMMAYPNYGGFPMWQWIPPTALDTSQDHVLRPPVA